MVQALIVFGADVECQNKAGFTARHLAANSIHNTGYENCVSTSNITA